jgi:hypothetical protein
MSNHDRPHSTTSTHREKPMFALLSRSTLLAGVLAAGLSATAWSADADTVTPKTLGVGTPAPMATASPADPGVAAAANTQTTVQEAGSRPTRAHGTLAAGKRYAATRARSGYFRPVHRYSLMLGIGY